MTAWLILLRSVRAVSHGGMLFVAWRRRRLGSFFLGGGPVHRHRAEGVMSTGT